MLRVAFVLVAVAGVSLITLSIVASNAYPRGEFHETGTPDYWEDLSGLDLPIWVRFDRNGDALLWIGLALGIIGGAVVSTTTDRSKEDARLEDALEEDERVWRDWQREFHQQHGRDPTNDEDQKWIRQRRIEHGSPVQRAEEETRDTEAERILRWAKEFERRKGREPTGEEFEARFSRPWWKFWS